MFFNLSATKLSNDEKKSIIQELEMRIGSDIFESSGLHEVENEYILKKDQLESCLSVANDEVPTKLSAAIKKAEKNAKQIEKLEQKSVDLKQRNEEFLNRVAPLRNELEKRFSAIGHLEEIVLYLKSFEKIKDISSQLTQCNDDEEAVLLYGELKEMCLLYIKGHRATYVKEYTHYWHNILKDKFIKQYEDILKLLKWPFTMAQEHSPPPLEVLTKFGTITKYLFLIEEPKDYGTSQVSGDYRDDQDPCLPVRILLRPLKKRFAFHFTGSRQTARVDRPEWFLTQTLTWIKDHQPFIRKHVQGVADRNHLRHIRAEDQFNAGLVELAAERLHTVLVIYQTQGLKGDMLDVDAAFAHAVDETLGFHKELQTLTGNDANSVLTVLTKAEIFIRWLAVERKYSLAKMDETLYGTAWLESACPAGDSQWLPRGADWFISLLKTIEDRYAVLPQPGHRLQFLELQLELIEEWRVRLMQLMRASLSTLTVDTFLKTAQATHLLTAVLNAAHHTRMVLLQWAHSLHYLQLHFYRRQFQHFTQQQHADEVAAIPQSQPEEITEENEKVKSDALSLKEVEASAQKLALNEAVQDDAEKLSDPVLAMNFTASPQIVIDPVADESEEAGVFGEAPDLLARLRDEGLSLLANDHMLMEFKAGLRPYKKQSWHAMSLVESRACSVSAPLCQPLGALCARLNAACQQLAPALASRLRAIVASEVDQYIFEEIVLQCWFNTGGTMQFTHDVKRNIVPAFAPPNTLATSVSQVPKLLDACTILNLDYDDARRLRTMLIKEIPHILDVLVNTYSVKNILPQQVLKILQQRTDLSDASPPSVMELF